MVLSLLKLAKVLHMSNQPLDAIELPATRGETFNFSALIGKPILIYFYPKDNTPGCTTQAEQFRDLYPEFQALGWAIYGISRDSLKSHERFKAELNLPFELVSDPDEKVCARFNVIKNEKFIWQTSARDRPQHFHIRRARHAAQDLARRQGSWSWAGSVGIY